MCGINGIICQGGNSSDLSVRLRQMNEEMAYRGPDDEGYHLEPGVGLSMRRLSIIDLGGGHQPLGNEDDSLVLVCNGEIYNYIELRRGLESRGHRFRTGSDCETILHLYEEKGERCVEDLRGMFAFILWDKRRRRLVAARGRFGIKPLYFAHHRGAYYLSSELKAIVRGAGISPTLDPNVVWQTLQYGYPLDPRQTAVKEIQRVLPGEYLVFEQGKIERAVYWTPPFNQAGTEERTDAELLATLDESVRIHLRSDVPVGILLSSGLDSSAIAAIAARCGGNFSALCAGFTGKFDRDERDRARVIARHLGMPMKEIVLQTDDLITQFDELSRVCDEPVADPSAVAQWALYAAGRAAGFKVLLSGIGGDELYFGYGKWNAASLHWAATGGAAYRNPLDASSLYSLTSWLLEGTARSSFRDAAAEHEKPAFDILAGQAPGPDAMYQLLFNTFLINNCLLLTDKLSMGCSTEVRVPLVDHVLMEQVLRLPFAQRFDANVTKPVFRRILAGLLPAEVVRQPKSGFNVPTQSLEILVRSHRDLVTDGVLASSWLDADMLDALLRRGGGSSTGFGRIVRALQRRYSIVLQELGWDRPARMLAASRATYFLYHIVVFEKWWNRIQEAARPREK